MSVSPVFEPGSDSFGIRHSNQLSYKESITVAQLYYESIKIFYNSLVIVSYASWCLSEPDSQESVHIYCCADVTGQSSALFAVLPIIVIVIL